MPIHTKDECKGHHCPFHNPSSHHMKNWPKIIRASGLIERECTHGVGHPDPDSLAYLTSIKPDYPWGVHGCCGCCDPENYNDNI